MKYPKYTKEQDLRCKLMNEDIKDIRFLYKKGISKEILAKKYKVHYATISYWLMTKKEREKRKEYYRNYRSSYFVDLEKKHKFQNKSLERKQKIMPKFKKYGKINNKKYYSKNKIKILKKNKKYYSENKIEILKKMKERYRKNKGRKIVLLKK